MQLGFEGRRVRIERGARARRATGAGRGARRGRLRGEGERGGLRLVEERAEERLGGRVAEAVEGHRHVGLPFGQPRPLHVRPARAAAPVEQCPVGLHLGTALGAGHLGRPAGKRDGELERGALERRLPGEGELGEALGAEVVEAQARGAGEERGRGRARIPGLGRRAERAEPGTVGGRLGRRSGRAECKQENEKPVHEGVRVTPAVYPSG